jgi:hypothetical protein
MAFRYLLFDIKCRDFSEKINFTMPPQYDYLCCRVTPAAQKSTRHLTDISHFDYPR